MTTSTRARATDPETSHEAGHAQTSKLRASQARVLAMFKLYGDMHDKQLKEYLHDAEKEMGFTKLMSDSGIRTRRSELVSLGKLRDTGRREKVDGHNCIVWGLGDGR